MALTKDRSPSEKAIPHGPEFAHSVATGYRVWRGSLCAVCADGTVVPAGSTNTPSPVVAIVGLARQRKNNTGQTGETGSVVGSDPIWVKKGCYALPFAETAPTWANLGQPVYAVDDESVSLTQEPSGDSTPRLQVGVLAGFEPDGTPFVTIR